MTDETKNHATPEGTQLGSRIAKYCDDLEPKARLKWAEMPPRCLSCAARKGPHLPNNSPYTQLDFIKCVVEEIPFYCHHGERAGALCSGWAIFNLAQDKSGPVKVPWKFT